MMRRRSILALLVACLVGVLAFPSMAEDADGDGAHSIATGGADCDDADPDRHPGNVEVTDAKNKDEDCDSSTLGSLDADGDGFLSMSSCNARSDGSLMCGQDCNDLDSTVHPRAVDACDGIDNDCDGVVDDVSGPMVKLYIDRDRDFLGDASVEITSCQCSGYFDGEFYVDNPYDCDDADGAGKRDCARP